MSTGLARYIAKRLGLAVLRRAPPVAQGRALDREVRRVVVLPAATGLLLAAGSVPAVEPGMELVRFASADPAATALSGYLFTPRGTGPFSAVAMMHGCGGQLTPSRALAPHYRAWATMLQEAGYAALAVDGFTPRGFRELCTRRDRPLSEMSDRPFDAYGALEYLRARPDVDPDRVALMGWSHGATAALAAMADGSPLRARLGLGAGFRAAVAFYPGCTSLKRWRYRAYAPTLVLVGLADDWTPARHCIELIEASARLGSPIEIMAYPDAHHGFDRADSPLRARVVENRAWKHATRTVHAGTHPEARADAIQRVMAFLASQLGS